MPDATTIEALHQDPANARRRTQRSSGMLVSSLREVGAARSIVIDENDRILAGNGTVEAAAEIGLTNLRVIEADGNTVIAVRRSGLTEEQKTRLALYDNRTGDLAEWDDSILREMASAGVDLGSFWTTEELDALIQSASCPEAGAGGDEFDPTPEDGPTRVQPGEVWRIGEHRLTCGDCTDAGTVKRLMGEDKARVTWTDPPYGVSYQDNETLESLKARNRRTDGKVVSNDSMTEKETEELVTTALFLAAQHSLPGGSVYVACPNMLLPHFIAAVVKSGFGYRHSLAWVKQHFVFGQCDYHYRHETILYGWKGDAAHYFVDDHTQDSVFEIDRPSASPEHPTMKPVELVQRMVANSSKPGDVVFDPFGGSGTTLIAAHRLGRQARLIEISAQYCDVILKRAEAEGIAPIEKLS